MNFFSRLATVGRIYKYVSYGAIPSAIGYRLWHDVERRKILEEYNTTHVNETLREMNHPHSNLLAEGLLVGIAWPLGFWWVQKHMNTTNSMRNMTDEEKNKTVLHHHMISELRNIPLDHVEKLSEYLLKHENKEECPFEVPVEKNPVSDGLQEMILFTLSKII